MFISPPYIPSSINFAIISGINISNITSERAEELLKNAVAKPEPTVLAQHPTTKEDITLNKGRYGMYLKCGKNNYAIPKGYAPSSLTAEEAIKIVTEKK